MLLLLLATAVIIPRYERLCLTGYKQNNTGLQVLTAVLMKTEVF